MQSALPVLAEAPTIPDHPTPLHHFDTARSGGQAMRDEHLTLITAQKAALMHLVPLCAGQLVELIKGKWRRKKKQTNAFTMSPKRR